MAASAANTLPVKHLHMKDNLQKAIFFANISGLK